mmetsp:Transcript_24175/g.67231  ORF Transcript_24175/g.67231 Transcript_24175/m.67231 type:complete len:765 (-) Transcript_24175:284-2578(-)|eukprot:CAMPEP_0117677208 /NCGR_PEP_ID=MMETSP0804-20121206/16622_1 /TAXON_ID=1074897 /ORGANISM="Tetraselmis astigmatica, Strain CCMP880" /LENGTH=764 /DNA_ID=CAMNT_0005486475 /DNA_START=84 /DNA_END=2378 /DNA_ORIENTATION=+
MWRLETASDSEGHPGLRTLNGHQGRQVWVFHPDQGSAQEREAVERLRSEYSAKKYDSRHSSDELLRLQCLADRRTPVVLSTDELPSIGPVPTERVTNSLKGAVDFYRFLQQEDGHWPGDYGGPMFLMPGLVITCYTTGCIDQVLPPQHKQEMLRYLTNHQNRDGGYGLHIEGESTMFGTCLSYVTLRLLGMDPNHEVAESARSWIQSRGGANFVASWGKFWLAVLGVYSWDGLNPMPPEMWLLPYSKWTGVGWAHPGRFWCHCRMVYLPMSYIYGRRATCPDSPLLAALREELYPQPYESIDWNKARNQIAKEDLYYPHPLLQDVLWWALYKFEYLLVGSSLRNYALAETMKHIHYEDENTRYIDIGPVNKVINMLSCWFENPDGEEFKKHIPRLQDYLWVAEDGMKMAGYNGSQMWDTSFAVQAIAAADDVAMEYIDVLAKAHKYIDNSQVRDDCPGPLDKWYRHISKGAWPFSTRDHGWPISDCSSEGLKAALVLAKLPADKVGEGIPADRLYDAVNVILSYQNSGGGWATYENTRSVALLELINPSETFGDIVIDYSYVECSSACITALSAFRQDYPNHRSEEIAASLARGEKYILSVQRGDGSWYGSWGVCFTYGVWFGCEALAALGHTYITSEALRRACSFLLSKQCKDGGWGESYLSCQDKVYRQLEGDPSHAVNTAWAMMALLYAGLYEVDPAPIDAGAAFLIRTQKENGDWPQQHISGVFNRNCMITYANYRNIFPIWALAKYRKAVHKASKQPVN